MKQIILYQTLLDVEIRGYIEMELFLENKGFLLDNLKIGIFSGHDQSSSSDAIKVAQYLNIGTIYKFSALNRSVNNLNKELMEMSEVVFKKDYDVIFFVSYHLKIIEFTKMITENYFRNQQILSIISLPGSIINIDLEQKNIQVFNPDNVLN